MTRKIGFVPDYFSELWRFLREPTYNVDNLRDPSKQLTYPPWTAFVSGTAIFASILAVDAARSVQFFDRVVLVTEVLLSAISFALTFHGVAKLLKGQASMVHVISGAEYLIGFLLPSLSITVYCVILLISLSPGLECGFGPLQLYCTNFVATLLNRVLLSAAYVVLITGAFYCAYRAFIFFRQLENLSIAKTLASMSTAGAVVYMIQGPLEFYSRVFSGQLDKVLKVLSGG